MVLGASAGTTSAGANVGISAGNAGASVGATAIGVGAAAGKCAAGDGHKQRSDSNIWDDPSAIFFAFICLLLYMF